LENLYLADYTESAQRCYGIYAMTLYQWNSGGASSENSPGPGKVLKMFARS